MTRQYLGIISIFMINVTCCVVPFKIELHHEKSLRTLHKFYMFIEMILNESKIPLQNMKLNIKDGDYIFVMK